MQGIKSTLASRRTPVRMDQAQMMVLLANELIRARQARPRESMEDFTGSPEYRRFLMGAYACNFVCSDLAPMQRNLGERELGTAPFGVVRHWVHHLLRSERWNHGYSSPIMDSIDSGCLAIVASRLASGEFTEPEVATEEDVTQG